MFDYVFKNKIKIFLCVFLFCLMVNNTAFAHQPRLVNGGINTIVNQEASQAYYGRLDGRPDFFKIVADKPFKLSVGILVPDIKDVKRNISVEINKNIDDKGNNVFVELIDAVTGSWTQIYEPFGGDYYWQGPEFKKDADPGTYNLKVFSPDNVGRYTLVIGDKEEWSIREIFKTILILPTLKKNFFNRSPFVAYFNYVGLFMAGLILLIVLVGLIGYMIIRKIRRARGRESDK